mmetsp:Transcript_1317/g.1775  ORF Transcript_1317/g.1775 Transcript_1317/m.1775 type:complete len:302 (+) Transcript_1317:175-1080(+)|eukprot:CAMPEP_0198143846 /NCGR_PEP_ID=MMETSP1443-20131203/10869_1 /TAXON_ID=186043 /ORGANISM="Entomoneis sp., Strain CCMP2396" /LENGTH=301 /DNA_ID=CAMNT_0043807135 /DNA_START=88 /DNA_END=993 /DNA_ORIENTATION=-
MAAEAHSHLENAGGHGDVLKHIVLRSHIIEQQKAHPEGILLIDTHCGPGLYDLGEQKSQEFEKGILRISKNVDDAPVEVQKYYQIVQEADEYLQQYPGSPVFAEKTLRPQDELRLCDLFVGDLKGLKKEPMLEKGDSYHPEAVNYFLPESDKHPVIFIDPSYTSDEDFYKAQALMERILAKNPYATVIIWYPLIAGNRYRYNFTKNLKDSAKKNAKIGYYHSWVIVQKEGMQGSSMFICNPTKKFDDVVDEEVLDYLSAILLKVGRSEYSLDQWMKKPKKKAGANEPEEPKEPSGPPTFAF